MTLPAVRSALERHRRRGRLGVRALGRAVDALACDGVVTDSELETVMRRIFRAAGETQRPQNAAGSYEARRPFAKLRLCSMKSTST